MWKSEIAAIDQTHLGHRQQHSRVWGQITLAKVMGITQEIWLREKHWSGMCLFLEAYTSQAVFHIGVSILNARQ